MGRRLCRGVDTLRQCLGCAILRLEPPSWSSCSRGVHPLDTPGSAYHDQDRSVVISVPRNWKKIESHERM